MLRNAYPYAFRVAGASCPVSPLGRSDKKAYEPKVNYPGDRIKLIYIVEQASNN